MDLQSITMGQRQAREAFLHYKHDIEARQKKERDAIEERILEEDKDLMEAYRVLARGQRVINFVEACLALGFNANAPAPGLPYVAICRASATRCGLRFRSQYGDEAPMFVDAEQAAFHYADVLSEFKSTVVMPRDAWTQQMLQANAHRTFTCKVPIIPIKYRPAEAQLKNYHLVFEAEWSLTPPADPFLVKRVSRSFYAIVAQWDLTPIERSLVSMR